MASKQTVQQHSARAQGSVLNIGTSDDSYIGYVHSSVRTLKQELKLLVKQEQEAVGERL